MLNESYYRRRIRPEHWEEFKEKLSGLNPPSDSVEAQMHYEYRQEIAEREIRETYADGYGTGEGDEV